MALTKTKVVQQNLDLSHLFSPTLIGLLMAIVMFLEEF